MINQVFRIAALWLALALSSPAVASQATLVTPGTPLPMTSLASFLNSALLSIGSCNSGNAVPANGTGAAAFAGECWINTTANPWVFSYTADGVHWSEFGTLNTSTFVWTPYSNNFLMSLGGNFSTSAGLAVTPGATGQVGTWNAGTLSGSYGPTLGVAGSQAGSISFANATSGTETLQPASGALGSGVATLAAGTYNIVGDSLSQTLTGKILNCASNSCTVRIASDVSGFGTGVGAALGNNLNASGGLVGFSGALGTPTSGTLTNATGLPISTGVGGLGTGVATALGNNPNASGGLVGFSGALGTPTSGTLTNATGLPISTGVGGLGTGVATALGNNSNAAGGVVAPTAALTLNGIVYGGGSGASPGSSVAGATGQVFLGVTSGAPQWGTMGGDATITNAGVVTINGAAVTYAKMQNVAASRLLGNPTGSPASPSEISLDATLGFSAGALKCTTATGAQNGCAHPDGTTITVNGAGALTASGAAATSIDASGATSVSNGKTRDFLFQNGANVGHTGLPYVAFAAAAGAI